MRPLILRRALLADHALWHDAQTDTDPLPATVTTDANGITSATSTRITEVKRETTDDQ
jgi:hypothetical protein